MRDPMRSCAHRSASRLVSLVIVVVGGTCTSPRRTRARRRCSCAPRISAAASKRSPTRRRSRSRRCRGTSCRPGRARCAAQLYRPGGRVRRTALLVPGVHSMGIAEPRLTALAQDLAGSGVAVMTMALPDLMGYQITRAIGRRDRGRGDVDGGAARSRAGRPRRHGRHQLRRRSLDRRGGPAVDPRQGRLRRLVRRPRRSRRACCTYLATGEAVQAPGVVTHPPHDYGVAVILYAAADRVVPAGAGGARCARASGRFCWRRS